MLEHMPRSGFWQVGLCLFATSGRVSGSHFKTMSRHNRLIDLLGSVARPRYQSLENHRKNNWLRLEKIRGRFEPAEPIGTVARNRSQLAMLRRHEHELWLDAGD